MRPVSRTIVSTAALIDASSVTSKASSRAPAFAGGRIL
jgi:hypothetical protein